MKAKALAVLIPALFIATTAIAQPAGEKPTAPAADQGAKNKQAVSEAALTGKVKSALAADVGLKTITGIDVDSDKGGVVTLKGKVDSADIKKRAGEVAKKVSGVKSVKNQLQVKKG
jgi:osmotically-inducible protein OsmY